MKPTSPQTASPRVWTRYTRNKITIIRPADRPHGNFSARIKFRKKIHYITLCDTVEESFKHALIARREILAERYAAFKKITGMRDECSTTLGDLLPHYRAFPGDTEAPPSSTTKEKNIQAFARIVALCHPDMAGRWEQFSLIRLTREFIVNWRSEVWKLANVAGTPDSERSIQIRRSANSTLLQARSLFTDSMLTYYRDTAKLDIPPCIAEFRTEPSFKKVSKTEYRAPNNNVIAATLADLEKFHRKEETIVDENMFIAAWLAIGFGLRAGEIKSAVKADFKQVDEDIYFDPPWRAKNNNVPLIGVQLDAWQRLEPFLTKGSPADYVIAGNKTERTGEVFLRISKWMKSLGWRTTHHVHELRAWAGCQIVMGPDGNGEHWLRGSRFMRHSKISTTQNFYGHHIQVKLEKVPLPKILATEFKPQLIQGGRATA